ncbi:hypothetical protein AMECASPLE_001628 [Ameca splendens]|uniref:Uncharacterized protein n=1 Tax=Ameca splendens TaxID=208324 RepID=A0ABV0Z8L9_9TELE
MNCCFILFSQTNHGHLIMKDIRDIQLILKSEFPSIFYGVAGQLLPISSGLQAKYTLDRSPVHHRATQANNHSHLRAIETNSLNSHVFGLWEEAGVPGGNPHMHRGNMQTPCRKTPGPELNPGPSYCKATVLPPAPLCSPEK